MQKSQDSGTEVATCSLFLDLWITQKLDSHSLPCLCMCICVCVSLCLSVSLSLCLSVSLSLSLTHTHTHTMKLETGLVGKNKKIINGAGEMAQRLRALPALPNVLSSIPSNHMVAHNHL